MNARRTQPQGERHTRWLTGLKAATVVLAVGGLAFVGYTHRDALPTRSGLTVAPIQRVLVEGPFERVDPTDVEAAVLPHLGGSFFTVDLDAIRAAAQRLPWVEHAQVVRDWPDRVRIVVTEQVPAWQWGDDGLLNARGELFVTGVDPLPPGLPRLDGPPGLERQLVERFGVLASRLAQCGMRPVALELDARRALNVALDGGIDVRVGRTTVDERIARFCDAAVPALAARLDRVAHVDMRYTNGFAVGWREG